MVTFVTGNPNKLQEVRAILNGWDLASTSIDLPEIQSMRLEEIVSAKARSAYEAIGSPVIVEDVSLEIAALGGFPGPFVKWWEKTVGYDTAVHLCERAGNWSARAVCGAGYDDGERFLYAEGVVNGRIAARAGDHGFGFDFYFVPDGYEETFAQLGPEAKSDISHRRKAFDAMRAFLDGQVK